MPGVRAVLPQASGPRRAFEGTPPSLPEAEKTRITLLHQACLRNADKAIRSGLYFQLHLGRLALRSFFGLQFLAQIA